MIKLSMPAFDPSAALGMEFQAHLYTYVPAQPDRYYAPFEARFYVDPFVGWVKLPVAQILRPTEIGFSSFTTWISVASPSSVGLRGGEGWFTLEPLDGLCWVTDCRVAYTPPVVGEGASVSHFS